MVALPRGRRVAGAALAIAVACAGGFTVGAAASAKTQHFLAASSGRARSKRQRRMLNAKRKAGSGEGASSSFADIHRAVDDSTREVTSQTMSLLQEHAKSLAEASASSEQSAAAAVSTATSDGTFYDKSAKRFQKVRTLLENISKQQQEIHDETTEASSKKQCAYNDAVKQYGAAITSSQKTLMQLTTQMNSLATWRDPCVCHLGLSISICA